MREKRWCTNWDTIQAIDIMESKRIFFESPTTYKMLTKGRDSVRYRVFGNNISFGCHHVCE